MVSGGAGDGGDARRVVCCEVEDVAVLRFRVPLGVAMVSLCSLISL